MHPVITIFCAFTRPWAVDKWLDNLANVQHDPALTNLCIIVDGDQSVIATTIKRFAAKYNYRSFHVKINDNWSPNETKLSVRRARIAEVKNQSKDLIIRTDGDIVISFEDDTVFDRLQNFDRLINPILNGRAAFVEGVQMGRWGANIIGAWRFTGEPVADKVETLLPIDTEDGYEEITGGGWYGYATKRELYLNCEYYTSTAQPWGPDVNYGVWLAQQGHKCLIDWQTIFGHNDYNKTLYPDDPKVRLAKIVYNKNITIGKWDRTDHEQTRY